MKDKPSKSKLTLAAEIGGAAAAIGLFCFQLFVSKEEIDNTPWLHAIQIAMVSLAAVAAVTLAIVVVRDKRKAKK